MAMRKDQVGKIAILADQNPVFGPCPLDMLQVTVLWTDERSTQNIMTSILKGLRNLQTDVNIQQELQAALAWPIAA